MYRDNTLIPTEAIRLAALGTLEAGPRHYADLARKVRGFASRFTGPSLDILGSSLELLRYEGLVEPVAGAGTEDTARFWPSPRPVAPPWRGSWSPISVAPLTASRS